MLWVILWFALSPCHWIKYTQALFPHLFSAWHLPGHLFPAVSLCISLLLSDTDSAVPEPASFGFLRSHIGAPFHSCMVNHVTWTTSLACSLNIPSKGMSPNCAGMHTFNCGFRGRGSAMCWMRFNLTHALWRLDLSELAGVESPPTVFLSGLISEGRLILVWTFAAGGGCVGSMGDVCCHRNQDLEFCIKKMSLWLVLNGKESHVVKLG